MSLPSPHTLGNPGLDTPPSVMGRIPTFFLWPINIYEYNKVTHMVVPVVADSCRVSQVSSQQADKHNCAARCSHSTFNPEKLLQRKKCPPSQPSASLPHTSLQTTLPVPFTQIHYGYIQCPTAEPLPHTLCGLASSRT